MLYIFDMGGVVTSNASIEDQVCKQLGITRQDMEDSGWNELMSLCSDGHISVADFWKSFSLRSGVLVKTDWLHWLFHPVLNEGTVKIIKALKEKGHRLVCGTNTIESHYRNHTERGDYTFFDQTYASFFMGTSKPNPDFWRIILQAENTDAGDAVFIDDKAENCMAASSLGIKAFHFTDATGLAKDLGLEGSF